MNERVNIEAVDELLKENAGYNATLGNDSTDEERSKVRWHIIRNVNKIKDLCAYTYNIISADDNHKS